MWNPSMYRCLQHEAGDASYQRGGAAREAGDASSVVQCWALFEDEARLSLWVFLLFKCDKSCESLCALLC